MNIYPQLIRISLLLVLVVTQACSQVAVSEDENVVEEPSPSQVELVQKEGTYRLFFNGEPFFIKGAGGNMAFEQLAAAGANTLRTWGSDQTELFLDAAHAAGLKVAAGIWIQHERHGFDYDNATSVQQQINEHKAAIDRFKDHPALLMWIVGNEVEINYTNLKVWDTIEVIASYIKEVDGNHPVATVTAHAVPEVINEAVLRCPSLDIWGMNSYAGIPAVVNDLKRSNWTGPFMITEWGPNGNWEVGTTSWGAEIEQTSTEKAEMYAFRYKHILEDMDLSLGSFAFFWGQKQETTPTWFGIFDEKGRHSEVLDTLTYLWSSRFPFHRAPRIANLTLNGKLPSESVTVEPGSTAIVDYQLLRGAANTNAVEWVLLRESSDKRLGGDAEEKPEEIVIVVESNELGQQQFLVPSEEGNYRLFLYVEGLGNSVACGNIPFRIEVATVQ